MIYGAKIHNFCEQMTYCEIFRNEIFRNVTFGAGVIMNPFKFGTIVEDEFFTDRVNELEQIKQMLDSENHLVLISPRRFGKSSLVAKALQQIGRPSITIDFMKVLNVEDLAAQVLRQVFRLHKFEKVKHFMNGIAFSSFAFERS